MDRTVALDILSNVSIASPCNVPWDLMKGDNRVRFCDECHLNVYNLSDMKALDAAELVQRSGGHLCIKFYQRADGTMLTTDCPKGLRPKIRWAAGRVAAAIAAAFGIVLGVSGCVMGARAVYMGEPVANRGEDGKKPGQTRIMGSLMPTTSQPSDGTLQRLK